MNSRIHESTAEKPYKLELREHPQGPIELRNRNYMPTWTSTPIPYDNETCSLILQETVSFFNSIYDKREKPPACIRAERISRGPIRVVLN